MWPMFSTNNKWAQPQVNSSNLCIQEQLSPKPSEMCISPKPDSTLTNLLTIEKLWVTGGCKQTAQSSRASIRGQRNVSVWPTAETQLEVSFCSLVSMIDGLRGTLGGKFCGCWVCVCTCAPQSHKCMCQPSDVSQRVCAQTNVWARRVPPEAGCRFHILLCL